MAHIMMEPHAGKGAPSGGPIEFWFDFSSGYAYFAAQDIDALGIRVGRWVTWRPYMLGTAFKVTGARGLSSTPLKSDYAMRDWQRLARLRGLAFAPPAGHPKIALPATRIFYWLEAQEPRTAVVYAKLVFDAYYAGRLDTSNLEQCAEVAARLGFERAAVMAGAQTAAVKDNTRRLSEEAVARGIFGSPYFIVDGEPFWGADRMEMMERWILAGGW